MAALCRKEGENRHWTAQRMPLAASVDRGGDGSSSRRRLVYSNDERDDHHNGSKKTLFYWTGHAGTLRRSALTCSFARYAVTGKVTPACPRR